MQKKLIALAAVAAISAPTLASAADASIYGKAFMTFDQFNSGAVGAVSTMRVNTNASRFGIKAEEDLGSGMKAFMQYEVQMDADGSVGNGLGNGTRNSGVGLEGGFGKVVAGIWDTPYKVAHNKIELFDNTTSWSATNVIGRSAGSNYNSRQANMVQYWSPKLGAVQAAFMYSPDEAKTAVKNASIMSMSATLEQDALYASVGLERRADVAVNGTTDQALRFVAKYDLGQFWVGAMFESIKVNNVVGGIVGSTSGKNSEFVGQFNLNTADSVAASFSKAGSTAAAGAAANDVSQLSLKYNHAYSKNTQVFGAYSSKTTNGVGGAAVSQTATSIGAGMVYSF